MTSDDKRWVPKPLPRDFATTEEVSEAAGVDRNAVYEWLRHGLLPAPRTTGGRGIISKWPLLALEVAKFVRSQRELGFGLPEIRARIVLAFGEEILKEIQEPKGPRKRGKTTAKKRARKPREP